jgi:FtsP/CotA-like multicopper oxidase with cupredoxin domain
MKRARLAAAIGTAALAAAGLGSAAAVAACGSSGPSPAGAAAPGGAAYGYYRSMMGRLYPGSAGMMGGTSNGWMTRNWMMGGTGYRWMTGGRDAPAWMRGSALPGYLMGTSRDPGKVMGALYAGAPGARVSASEAARLGSQVPAGATVNRARHQITFAGPSVRLTVLASPASGPDETFRAAGLVDPVIAVQAGARVSIEVINADPDTAHGLVVTSGGATSSWMTMLTARPAFPGSAVWFLGDPTSAGLHTATLAFTAGSPGTYRYLCPVPGHAQKGMTGRFTVSA